MTPTLPRIAIACPATAESNNGNWRTAQRWQSLLQDVATVRIVAQWPQAQPLHAPDADDVLLALHARKSAASIAAWHAERGARGLGVALTGTDLYPDITRDALAMQSLALAKGLVVLQAQALQALPAAHRAKTRVIHQSCSALAPMPKAQNRLHVVMVGHLRTEKNPAMLWRAVRAMSPEMGIVVTHIGQALQPEMAEQAQATMQACPYYRWLPGCTHAQTLRHIQRAHLLVHTSHSEGGAIVISEAVRCGTPVLATRIDGNVGLLGTDYEGLIEPEDDPALRARLLQCRHEQQTGHTHLLHRWQAQCALRAPLFDPATERAALRSWVEQLMCESS